MKISISPKTSIPLKAVLPGFVGFLTITLKRGIQKILLHTQIMESEDSHEFLISSTFPNGAENESKLLFGPVYDAFEGIGKTLLESYNNYFTFMLMMLLINMIIHGTGLLFAKERTQKTSSLSQYSLKETTKIFFRAFITYSLIFCSFQIIWTLLALIFDDNQDLFQRLTQNPMDIDFSQTEEEESFLLDQYETPKPSLSIGKVMSQLDISAYSVLLSKDEKKAFVIGNVPPTLKIIDVSDSEYPVILSSFSLVKVKFDIVYKAILLSQDEKQLFISNFESLQIIDISNLKSPVNIATVQDESFMKEADSVGGAMKPSLLMSRESKFLFATGYGLQVFDISNTTNTKIISSVPSQKSSKKFIPSRAFLSPDGKRLFYSDGSLWVYNAENPQDLKVLGSFNSTFEITSIVTSENTKTVFLLGLDSAKKMLLQRLDTSNINSIFPGKIIQLTQSISLSHPIFLEQAPNNPFLFINYMDTMTRSWHNLLIFDTNEERVLVSDRMLVNGALSLAFTKDSKKVILGFLHKFKIVDLYLDFPNKNAFSQSTNTIQAFEIDFKHSILRLSPSNESLLYSLKSFNAPTAFGIHRISSQQQQVTNISFYEFQEEIKDLIISQDNQRAFLLTSNVIFLMNISDPTNMKLLGKYVEGEKDKNFIILFTLSCDGKTGYITHNFDSKNYLSILDFSDPTSPTKKSSVDLGLKDSNLRPILSEDERTIFIANNELYIYNVSDPLFPVFVSNLTFQMDGLAASHPPEVILSPDGRTLFIADPSSIASGIIHIIDVTDVRAPELRSEFSVSPLRYFYSSIDRLCAISPDSRTFYAVKLNSIAVVDISNLNSPRYLGDIKVLDTSEEIREIMLSNDGKKVYIHLSREKFLVSSIQPGYSTFMTQDTLLLGERYSIDIFMIQLNKYLHYNRMDTEYKLTKFSVVEPVSTVSNATIEKTIPSWMSLDLKSQTLLVEARRKSDIGIYRVYVGFSTQLNTETVFSGITLDKCEDILTSLVSIGYLDNQLFLTEKFGAYKDFLLPEKCFEKKREIYEVLQKYSFGTYNEVKVIQSLEIMRNDGKLRIQTASVANLKVEINLLEGGKFLSRNYASLVPVITHNKSQLILEGSLKDINLALKEVVIYLQDEKQTCDGEITIDDKLNPVMTESMKSISRDFNHNKPPGLNEEFPLTIQDQINRNPVSTGQFFQIKLDEKTFSDDYTFVENLHYHVVFIQDNNETVALPNWVSFCDMTLTGTAPEEIWNRDFEFKLVVRNEFQEHKEPFKLHVKISSGFVFKLLLKYSPYVLSIVGLLISANKISNVIFKESYKHPKDFYLKIGEEVTSEVIFPIGFIQEEAKEAKKILRVIEKRIGSGRSDKLLGYFIIEGERKLDKLKILETIKNGLNELSFEEKSEFELYLGGGGGEKEENSHCKLIDQIIINTLTMYQLNSSEERETKEYYEKIKKQWSSFVEWDIKNSSFEIRNNQKFNNKHDEETILLSDMEKSSLSESLVKNSNFNLDLLKDAILAYAFDCQNIDILPVQIEIKVKEKIKTNFLKTFLKRDLKYFPFSEKGKIGYGIGYRKKYNTVFFNGVVDPDIRNKTLVLQITNHRQKILKELWIFGRKQGKEQSLGNSSETEAKGKEYEIF